MRALFVLFAVLLATPAVAAEPSGDFTLPDLAGTPHNLSDYTGKKVILINFWATWCAPCLKEMPELNKIQQAMPDDVQIISITIDDPRDAAKAKAIVKRMKYQGLVLHDAETRVVSTYNPNKDMPYTLIIGKDGQIHHKKKGFTSGDQEKLKKWLEELAKG